jgi:3'(2'), 5'-bisphosphate nucleotidase
MGKKIFLASNDEFTVNIASIEGGHPVLRVVYAPALDELYMDSIEEPTFFINARATTNTHPFEKTLNLRMTVSRSHDHPDVSVFAASNHIGEFIPMRSALKYGRLAVGRVEVFPRMFGRSEWDTTVGQAALEPAGGFVLDWHSGKPLSHCKSLWRNPGLLSLRARYRFNDFKLKYDEPKLL